ncbi:Longin-like domain-containing protein [Umbelopsis sp. PMI_123]|nr:Longin-like domain-containing protein [Umbelopsis sp. PMI_123]
MVNLSLYAIKAVILLDAEGNRVLSKYYGKDYASTKDQKAFEKGLFDKTKRAQGEIIMYDNQIVLYRSNIDIFFYVVASADENELMISSMLNAFYDAVSTLLRYMYGYRHQLEKRSILDNLDLVVLCLDETVDDGIILETDSNAIVGRVSKPRLDVADIPLSEQSFIQAYQTARERITNQLLR